MKLNKLKLIAITASTLLGGSVFASSNLEEMKIHHNESEPIGAIPMLSRTDNKANVYVGDFSSMNMGSIRAMIEGVHRINNCLPKELNLRDQSDLARFRREFIFECKEVLRQYDSRTKTMTIDDLRAGYDVQINWHIDVETGTLKLRLCRFLEKIDNLQLDNLPELVKEIGIISELGRSLRLLPE